MRPLATFKRRLRLRLATFRRCLPTFQRCLATFQRCLATFQRLLSDVYQLLAIFSYLEKSGDRPTDRWTDGRTDAYTLL